jgi:hypothetical protein
VRLSVPRQSDGLWGSRLIGGRIPDEHVIHVRRGRRATRPTSTGQLTRVHVGQGLVRAQSGRSMGLDWYNRREHHLTDEAGGGK